MASVALPALILAVLGALFGLGLAIASRRFCVEQDPRIEKIFKRLPGANCGACGFPGCMGFAEALIQGGCTPEKCTVSDDDARHEIARILGLEHTVKERTTAVLHCHGGIARAKDKYAYSGVSSCIDAAALHGGPKQCRYGCIGLGTCQAVCPFGAITMSPQGLPVVDEAACTSCGRCVAVCPKKLFSIAPVSRNYAVRCKSLDLGKAVMQSCSVGCIACRKCEKACPVAAIKVVGNCAVIDYERCKNHGECFKVCPTNAIAHRTDAGWKNRKEQG